MIGTTTCRNEQNPIPGRHKLIFPMFEFELKGDINDLINFEKELLEELGFGKSKKYNYKNINYRLIIYVFALTIIGILNINRDEDFPYVFGGDGASLIIPANLLEQSKKVLLEASKKAKSAFDLELRI